MFDYREATVLVTGASKGIGRALSRDLARRGATTILVARSADALEQLATELRNATGASVAVVPADLADSLASAHITSQLAAQGLAVDVLINNAGMGAVGPFLERPLDATTRSIEVNITALVGLTRALGPQMVERGRGGIVNVGSVAGFLPMPFQSTYGASKAYVVAFTEALAEELRGTGVHVMGAHPGPVATEFFHGTDAEVDAKAVSPERIAQRILDAFARGRSISFPGQGADRVIAGLPRLLPPAAIARLTGRVNRANGYSEAGPLDPAPRTSSQR